MSLFVDIIRITYLITENKFKIQRKNIYKHKHTCKQEKSQCDTVKPPHFCSVLFTITQAPLNKCSYYCLIQESRRYQLFADIHRWCHPLQGAFVLCMDQISQFFSQSLQVLRRRQVENILRIVNILQGLYFNIIYAKFIDSWYKYDMNKPSQLLFNFSFLGNKNFQRRLSSAESEYDSLFFFIFSLKEFVRTILSYLFNRCIVLYLLY